MTRTPDTAVAPSTVRAVQAAAVLTLLVLGWQFVTAGRISVGEDALGGHAAGAIALHVTSALLLLATALHGRRTRVWWPAALAGVVLVLGFVQAALGSSGSIEAHVPLALLLVVGTAWLAAWAFRSPA
ncbi:hypothetical protein [Geodermatophilus sp. DSM 44513]|uniref:hypothetical protein n=1 Tax=Geodermatophilus sp. DSM 44513 TaxID=1528104 RepID=UPI0012732CE1|nr:hypothetical protein [Geodermatophilus sp. DSM 44513]WNV76173.1 hypothetical protein RTG05_02595 [Geodermatophilus sp. DSM 44513]